MWVIWTAENQVDYSRLSSCTTLYQLKMLPMSTHVHTELFLNICKVILAIYHVQTLRQLLMWLLALILGCLWLLHHSQPSKSGRLRKEEHMLRFSVLYALYYHCSAGISSRNFSVSAPHNSPAHLLHVTRWQTKVLLSWEGINRSDQIINTCVSMEVFLNLLSLQHEHIQNSDYS